MASTSPLVQLVAMLKLASRARKKYIEYGAPGAVMSYSLLFKRLGLLAAFSVFRSKPNCWRLRLYPSYRAGHPRVQGIRVYQQTNPAYTVSYRRLVG